MVRVACTGIRARTLARSLAYYRQLNANGNPRHYILMPLPPLSTFITTSLFGHRITAFRNDHIGKKIRKTGLYEKENVEFCLELLRQLEAPVVMDVGANIGNHALAFSTVAACIHAFEPLPPVFDILQQNIRQNGIGNILAHPIALSDENGESTIHMVSDRNIGASSFEKPPHLSSRALSVTKRKGDDIVNELGLARIDLLKIDVESHEAFVLNGLEQSIRRFRPVIIMEWNDPAAVKRLRGSAIMGWIGQHYHTYVVCKSSERIYWEGSRFPGVRRMLARLFGTPTVGLRPFDPSRVHKNILMVPRDSVVAGRLEADRRVSANRLASLSAEDQQLRITVPPNGGCGYTCFRFDPVCIQPF